MHVIADAAVDGISKVDRRGTCGKSYDLALRREDEDFVGNDVVLKKLHEVLGIVRVALCVEELSYPLDLLVVDVFLESLGVAGFLIVPVRGDSVLGLDMHAVCSDLDFERRLTERLSARALNSRV